MQKTSGDKNVLSMFCKNNFRLIFLLFKSQYTAKNKVFFYICANKTVSKIFKSKRLFTFWLTVEFFNFFLNPVLSYIGKIVTLSRIFEIWFLKKTLILLYLEDNVMKIKYILLNIAFTEVDAVGSEMIDEVLQYVHLVGGDVVKGDGEVTAASESFLLRVELETPVPAFLVNLTRDEVVFGDEGEEPLPALEVP